MVEFVTVTAVLLWVPKNDPVPAPGLAVTMQFAIESEPPPVGELKKIAPSRPVDDEALPLIVPLEMETFEDPSTPIAAPAPAELLVKLSW